MKAYTVEIEIDLPRGRVIELFDNPDNLVKWQTGLQSFEPVSGEPGQPGAVSKLVYRNGKRKFELFETVIERTLPDPGESFGYLVTAVTLSGEGALGRTSAGEERPNLRPCP